jgi:hypothetical protein
MHFLARFLERPLVGDPHAEVGLTLYNLAYLY